MTLAHLPQRERRAPKNSGDSGARERVLALVTEIEGDDRLTLAADILSDIIAYQPADTRALTTAEMRALDRAGIREEDLVASGAPNASVKSALWERQAELDTYSVAEAASLLGVTTARIRQRCAAGTLFAWRLRDGWHLPTFQFPDGRELRGWATVAPAIAPGTPFIVAERVLTTPSPRLVVEGEYLAPFEWLAQGGAPETAAAAVDDALNRLP